jgi:hypothetical protein
MYGVLISDAHQRNSYIISIKKNINTDIVRGWEKALLLNNATFGNSFNGSSKI